MLKYATLAMMHVVEFLIEGQLSSKEEIQSNRKYIRVRISHRHSFHLRGRIPSLYIAGIALTS